MLFGQLSLQPDSVVCRILGMDVHKLSRPCSPRGVLVYAVHTGLHALYAQTLKDYVDYMHSPLSHRTSPGSATVVFVDARQCTIQDGGRDNPLSEHAF